MGKPYDAIDGTRGAFIEAQHLFFVATRRSGRRVTSTCRRRDHNRFSIDGLPELRWTENIDDRP